MIKRFLVLSTVCAGALACGPLDESSDSEAEEQTEEEAEALAIDPTVPIADDLNQGSQNKLGEVSGIVASSSYPGFIWMHRDGYSADRPSRERLYAMKVVDRELVSFNGASGTYPTREFKFASGLPIDNINWEDMAIGRNVVTNSGSSLYIGDIGNNSGGRNAYKVYQIAEPNPSGSSATIGSLQATWKFKYPPSAKLSNGEWPNCETMFYLDRNLYIVTKESDPRVYRFPSSFYQSPGVTHELQQVTNGGTTRVVGAVANPSFASFSADKQRFMIGGHKRFFVYEVANSSLTGDALVKSVLLTAGSPEDWDHDIADSSDYPKLNTEGGTYEAAGKGLVFATESKAVFHWPQANTEAP